MRMMNKMYNQKTDLNECLKIALEVRIQERRTVMSKFLQYLHNHDQPDDLEIKCFQISIANEITKKSITYKLKMFMKVKKKYILKYLIA